MSSTKPNIRTLLSISLGLLLGTLAAFPSISSAQGVVHFGSICRSDPAANKDVVTIVLHQGYVAEEDPSNPNPAVGETVNVLWSYVDYRQNHAVFKYRQDSCVTDNNGACKFSGGSGRARWQFIGIDNIDTVDTAFDATANCPDGLVPANSFMIDFW